MAAIGARRESQYSSRCHDNSSSTAGRPNGSPAWQTHRGPRHRTGRSALFGVWDAHRATGGRLLSCLRSLTLWYTVWHTFGYSFRHGCTTEGCQDDALGEGPRERAPADGAASGAEARAIPPAGPGRYGLWDVPDRQPAPVAGGGRWRRAPVSG